MTGSGHDALPLPDYDHIPLGTLPTRITGLDESGLQALLDYEEAHGDRLPVKLVLQNRLEAVQGGAELSEGAATSMPEVGSTAAWVARDARDVGPAHQPAVTRRPDQPGHAALTDRLTGRPESLDRLLPCITVARAPDAASTCPSPCHPPQPAGGTAASSCFSSTSPVERVL